MKDIQLIVRLKIHDGKLEEFKRVASQFMQVIRTKDTGTLQYELNLNKDETECLVLERHRDVQALVQHQANASELLNALLKTCTASGIARGEATPELLKALESPPMPLFSPYQAL